MLVDFKDSSITLVLLKYSKIGNIGGVLDGLLGVFYIQAYTQLICVCLPKIIQFYIINMFKLITTCCLLTTILLLLTQC